MVKTKKILGWLKTGSIYLLLIIAISVAVDFWRAQSIASGQAPEMIAFDIKGEKVDIAAMSEKEPVLLYFWGTWCPICSSVSPSVNFLADYYPTVTVALTSGKPARVQQYLDAKGYDFSTLNDPKGVLSKQWGVSVTPTLFIIDKGEITSVTTGFTSPIGIWPRLVF